MKAAAIRAKAATEDYASHRISITACISECEEFNNLSDGPDNTIALVEALEARDKQIADLKQAFRIALSAAGISVAVEGE
ncbi:hypothetical protein [Escherichia coli]|nr:hypothetical protein [Escherichia coli]MCB4483536.1 hypothetical protein [Escherichia coli]